MSLLVLACRSIANIGLVLLGLTWTAFRSWILA